jgi:hypothetical protein
VALHGHHGLTLPIALIGTFLFMNMFGFTINMITLMALSLCVGLLIDDAIVVRENIVRHVQMGKGAYQAAMDGTQEIGLAVLATTLSIVAVFMPIGFMGGIIGKFFHEFGITIVAAVLISMFVSFTLDPMLSSVWHDPSIHAHGSARKPVSLYDKTIGRVTGWFDRATDAWPRATRRHPALVAGAQAGHAGIALGIFVLSVFMVPLLGTEFVPKADFSETTVNFYTPWARRWRPPRPRRGRWKPSCASFPRCATRCPPSTPAARRARCTPASMCAWWTARTAAAAWTRCRPCCASACKPDARHHRHPRGPAGPGGRAKADRVLAAGA